ncbi:MAG: hypothetical protein HY235_26645 [Acidobacteria bacterium]|nr:hypothetical protein [Acidobacteriota bacterium]
MGLFADGLVEKYWKLSISASTEPGNRVVTVSCNRYLMNTAGYKPMQTNINQVEAAAKGRKGLFVDHPSFFRTVLGKGLPSDMEHVLEAGVKCGALASDPAQLQKWVDKSLGVDCTGFASAYHFLCGVMPLGDSANAGCEYFRRMANRQNPGNAYVWSFDEVQPDDVMLWMRENGVETKKPGHIALICGKAPGRLLIAESSGAADQAGHSGPRLNEKPWKDPAGQPGSRYLPINEGVIIVRTINKWYPKSLFTGIP